MRPAPMSPHLKGGKMIYLRRFLPVICLVVSMLPPANAATFDLRLDRLADSFKLLQETDRASVDEVSG